jgi:anaerobic magnesium-protoporphyrin IX monomethyl ester cyclase
MRISYIKPPIGGILGLEMLTFVEPLGLECVAGALEGQGHQQQIIDLRLEGYEEGLGKCQQFNPDLIGIQCNFTTERFRTMKLVSEIRKRMPSALVIVGGHDASRVPEWFIEQGVEVVVVGDGEDVMKLLVETLQSGGDLANSPGLYLKRGK